MEKREVKETDEIHPLKKVAVGIIVIMWIAISYGVASSLNLPVWQIIIVLGVLWLLFVIIAYLILRDWSQ